MSEGSLDFPGWGYQWATMLPVNPGSARGTTFLRNFVFFLEKTVCLRASWGSMTGHKCGLSLKFS